MKEIVSICPDKSHFFAFLNGQDFLDEELKKLEQINPSKVFIDSIEKKLTIEYNSSVQIGQDLLEKIAFTLKNICGLKIVDLVNKEVTAKKAESFSFLEHKEDIIAKIRLRCSEAARKRGAASEHLNRTLAIMSSLCSKKEKGSTLLSVASLFTRATFFKPHIFFKVKAIFSSRS